MIDMSVDLPGTTQGGVSDSQADSIGAGCNSSLHNVVNMARQSAFSPVSREARQKLSATIRLSATSEFALDRIANDSKT